ncbi:MAG: hypothetical protein AAGE38_04265 [Pseudomonadota bacterium]
MTNEFNVVGIMDTSSGIMRSNKAANVTGLNEVHDRIKRLNSRVVRRLDYGLGNETAMFRPIDGQALRRFGSGC